MTAYVLKGTRQQITRDLAQLPEEVREAIVFVEDPATIAPEEPAGDNEDIFAEMQPFAADGTTEVDDSRQAVYTQLEGE